MRWRGMLHQTSPGFPAMNEREAEQGIQASQHAADEASLQPALPQADVPSAAAGGRRSDGHFDSDALVSAERQREYENDRAAFLTFVLGFPSIGLLGWLTERRAAGFIFFLALSSWGMFCGAITLVICWAARRD